MNVGQVAVVSVINKFSYMSRSLLSQKNIYIMKVCTQVCGSIWVLHMLHLLLPLSLRNSKCIVTCSGGSLLACGLCAHNLSGPWNPERFSLCCHMLNADGIFREYVGRHTQTHIYHVQTTCFRSLQVSQRQVSFTQITKQFSDLMLILSISPAPQLEVLD